MKADAGSCALASLETSKEELRETFWYSGVFAALWTPLWSTLALNDGRAGPPHWPQGKDPLARTDHALAQPHSLQPRVSRVMLPEPAVDGAEDTSVCSAATRGNRTSTVDPINGLLQHTPVCPLVSACGAKDAFAGSRGMDVVPWLWLLSVL
ncbi:Alpha/beta hydrolase fold-1 [Penicillium digitatum]|uniref:Alpha/beta hydrolase fold-1 n=1 Tax=Penicillium digitatum TaxID=36651 RepID=A0A7T7BPA0_PENDI|nr:hypothetical protein PDIDSM_548 [Penicillium digitatum]QQK47120.1 Alpha/beta hydrolase fold-1 [Penicillium digitatum]